MVFGTRRNDAGPPEDADKHQADRSQANDGTSVTGTPVFAAPPEGQGPPEDGADKVEYVASQFEEMGNKAEVKDTGKEKVYHRPYGKGDDQMVRAGSGDIGSRSVSHSYRFSQPGRSDGVDKRPGAGMGPKQGA
jgi:hypothetical protein